MYIKANYRKNNDKLYLHSHDYHRRLRIRLSVLEREINRIELIRGIYETLYLQSIYATFG